MALHTLVDHQNVDGWWLVLNYMWTPPTHCYLEYSGRATYIKAQCYNNPLMSWNPKSGSECFPKLYFSNHFFFLHLDIIKFGTSRANQSNYYIHESKIWTLKWLKPFLFLCCKINYFWESNNASDMSIFGFPHQIMQLVYLANHIRDQVFFMHLEGGGG